MMVSFALLAALSATPVTLEEVRRVSHRNGPATLAEIERSRAQAERSRSLGAILPQVRVDALAARRLDSAREQRVPSLEGSAGPEEVDVRLPATQATELGATLQVSQTLFDGGRWWNRIAATRARHAATQAELEEALLSSELEAVRRFFELYRSQEAMRALQGAVQRAETHRARSEALQQAGRASRGEVLSASAEVSSQKAALHQSRGRIGAAQGELGSWLLMKAEADLVAQAPPGGFGGGSPPALAQALGQARESRPLLRALSLQRQASARFRAVARGAYWPRLSAELLAGRAASTSRAFVDDVARQNFFQVGLGLRWDLFPGLDNSAETSLASLELQATEVELAMGEAELEADVRASHARLEHLDRACQEATAGAALASDALLDWQERFRLGVGPGHEVRAAQERLARAELLALDLCIDRQVAAAAFRRSLGQSPAEPR